MLEIRVGVWIWSSELLSRVTSKGKKEERDEGPRKKDDRVVRMAIGIGASWGRHRMLNIVYHSRHFTLIMRQDTMCVESQQRGK